MEMSSAECLALLKSKDTEYTKGAFSEAMKKVLIENIADASECTAKKEIYANLLSTVHLFTTEIIKNKN